MIVLDVNVLVAAYFSGHPFHDPARRFLSDSLASGGVGVPDVVWSGFVRIITNPAVTQPPATWPQVRAFVDAVQHHPGYNPHVRSMTSPLDSLLSLCQLTGAKGNLVSDAYIAATAVDHRAAVATWDADFNRFPAPVLAPPN